MNSNLDYVNFLKSQLNNLQPIKPEYQKKVDEKFRLEFNYNSNHLEGNTLTYGETKLLLIFGDTVGNHQKREFDEMEAHDVAYNLVKDWAKDTERPLSENLLKELNQIILVKPYWKDAIIETGEQTKREIDIGKYKQYPNSVKLENGEIFAYTSPTETPIEMAELIKWYREEMSHLHPVTLATMLHYKFVRIHPFDDGNGRIARLLLNYVLIKFGFPPVIIKSLDKRNYLNALHLADAGNYEMFINYIAKQLVWSLEININGAKGLSIEEPQDWEKKLDLVKKSPIRSKFKQKNSFSTFNDIYQNTILPIIELWNGKISNFDDLFEGKNIQMQLYSDNGNFEEKGKDLYYFPIKFFADVFVQRAIIYHEFNIYLRYNNLKQSNIQKEFIGGFLEFQFDEFSYEIDTPTSTYSFLYGEFLTEQEQLEIVNQFGKQLLEDIENEKI